jgi:hypothetical protein
MSLSIPRVGHYLRQFDLEKLFVEELGWDRYSASFSVQVDGRSCPLRAVAEKRGVQILMCESGDAGSIPDYATRRKIEKQVTKSAYEHLIIYVDQRKTQQIWQWVFRQPGQPAGYREHHYHPGHQQGDSLIQKLQTITFQLSEEEVLTLTGVAFRLRDTFYRDRVTKRFYEHFKTEHAAFLGFIKGVIEQGDREWYASLMLNRLMFVYFIQRKGFLDGDPGYLKNRLKMVRERKGKDKFLTFYRYFLLRLFHEGFSQQPPQRASGLDELLGQVPYLNGGLFELHELEAKYTDLDVPDEAFERLFAFFDQYEWHLDSRPLRNDLEINPDVLGYIFEKYINQKQMGAYYTKEDITEYISKNTIIPYLFDAAQKKCAIAFQPESSLWRLLQIDPDRYIYPAVREGVIDERGDVIPLPEEIAKGIELVSQRKGWNSPAAAEFALPTETWREHVARRQRCLDVREKLLTGQIHAIDDFITYNLNVRQFAEDVISNCEGPELLRAFYQVINNVTVLDPTCGSGAFLFAAANILEPLYGACLERMQGFVDDLDRSGERHRPEKFSDFRRILAEIERHPNRLYFIFKSIILKNLFGVDIMEEAVEICKLRLFLKLVAQVEKVQDLEPLPDIDFNIRAGNTLVGFTTVAEIRRAAELETPKVQGSASKQILMVSGQAEKAIRRIEEEAKVVERAYGKFHEMQREHGMNAREFSGAKTELRSGLKKLDSELDRYLAREYQINQEDNNAYNQWRNSHQPFHWLTDFYGIMREGGFDVVLGNPPYVEYARVRQYSVKNFQTGSCGNLFAFVLERSNILLGPKGRLGLILPLSLLCTDRMGPARSLLGNGYSWIPAFDIRPTALFDGVAQRLCILINRANTTDQKLYIGGYRRWSAVERSSLFSLTSFAEVVWKGDSEPIPKLSFPSEACILRKIVGPKLGLIVEKKVKPLYIHRICRYFVKAINFIPVFIDQMKNKQRSDDYKPFYFKEPFHSLILCLINSSLFYWFWRAHGDGFHCGYRDVYRMSLISDLPSRFLKEISSISNRLMDALNNASRMKNITTKRGQISYQEFYPKLTKGILDEVDRSLGHVYGFTDHEIDFLINYDFKYRMGDDNEHESVDEFGEQIPCTRDKQ